MTRGFRSHRGYALRSIPRFRRPAGEPLDGLNIVWFGRCFFVVNSGFIYITLDESITKVRFFPRMKCPLDDRHMRSYSFKAIRGLLSKGEGIGLSGDLDFSVSLGLLFMP